MMYLEIANFEQEQVAEEQVRRQEVRGGRSAVRYARIITQVSARRSPSAARRSSTA